MIQMWNPKEPYVCPLCGDITCECVSCNDCKYNNPVKEDCTYSKYSPVCPCDPEKIYQHMFKLQHEILQNQLLNLEVKHAQLRSRHRFANHLLSKVVGTIPATLGLRQTMEAYLKDELHTIMKGE